jgi:thiamine pyrophosphokinase
MQALIVTGGESPPAEIMVKLAKKADIVIAADSGFDAALAAGLFPDLVVGDFDSLADRSALDALPADKVIEYSAEKDDTDTEIAINEALKRGADQIVVAGGGGGRLDHLLAMTDLFARGNAPRAWHTRNESVFFLDKGQTAGFALYEDAVVSVFPASAEESRGMASSGLRWPLAGLSWEKGYFGVSNRSVGDRAEISAGTCPLLVVVPIGCERLF